MTPDGNACLAGLNKLPSKCAANVIKLGCQHKAELLAELRAEPSDKPSSSSDNLA